MLFKMYYFAAEIETISSVSSILFFMIVSLFAQSQHLIYFVSWHGYSIY